MDASVSTSYRTLFALPAIRRVMFGIVVGRTAGTMTSITLVLFTLAYFHSPELAGWVTFASIAPGLLMAPLAGVLLDRHGRVRLIQLDYLVAALSMFVIAGLSVTGQLTAPLLLAISVVSALTAPLSTTGLRSLIPRIVPEPLWPRANAIDSNGYVVATLIGPPVAGALVAFIGGAQALAVVGLVWTGAALAMIGLPDPRTEFISSGRLRTDALDGVRYVARNRTLRALALCISLLNIGGGIEQILVPVMLINVLGQGPGTVGVAWAVSGVGGLVSALLVGRLETRGREKALIVWTATGFAVVASLWLLTIQVWSIVLVLAVLGLLNGPSDVGMFTLRQRRTDPAWTGRAFAVSMSLNFAGFPIGSAIGGALVGLSVPLTVLIIVVVSLLSAVTAWLLIPDRDIEYGRA